MWKSFSPMTYSSG